MVRKERRAKKTGKNAKLGTTVVEFLPHEVPTILHKFKEEKVGKKSRGDSQLNEKFKKKLPQGGASDARKKLGEVNSPGTCPWPISVSKHSNS